VSLWLLVDWLTQKVLLLIMPILFEIFVVSLFRWSMSKDTMLVSECLQMCLIADIFDCLCA
jgi:hypothetical protein